MKVHSKRCWILRHRFILSLGQSSQLKETFQSLLWDNVQILIGGSVWGKRNKWAIDLSREYSQAPFHVSVRWTKLHQACREENCGIAAHLSSMLQWNGDVWLQGAPQDTFSSNASLRIPRCVLGAIPHLHLLLWFKSSISDSRSLFPRLEHWSIAVFKCYSSAPLPLPSRGFIVRKKTFHVP